MINGLVTWINCKQQRSILKSKYSEKKFLSLQPPYNHWAMGDAWLARSHVTHTLYKKLVDDLAHLDSPIAQWLQCPTGIWKVMGSTPVGGSENSFSEYFDLRTLLHYLHFMQVTNPCDRYYFCVPRGALKLKFSMYLKLSDSLSEQTEWSDNFT